MESTHIELEKSERDENIYRFYQLENGVKCLLVHDRNSKPGGKQDISSVSVSVNAGSFNDPPHRAGLAHFLEHMIFMGSEKYPGEKAFNDHVA